MENHSLLVTPFSLHNPASRARSGLRPIAFALAAATFALAGCSDVPDPADYGGGEEGKTMAQCISRTERANSSISREEAAQLCTCLTDRIASGAEDAFASGSVAGAETERAVQRCADDNGIELD